MKKNNLLNESKSSFEKLLFLLPKSCGCHTCKETKKYIKNEMGESTFLNVCKKAGIHI